MLAGPGIDGSEPAAAQQVGVVAPAVLPVGGQAFQLRAQPQQVSIGLDGLTQRPRWMPVTGQLGAP